jgi:hypothetical protein
MFLNCHFIQMDVDTFITIENVAQVLLHKKVENRLWLTGGNLINAWGVTGSEISPPFQKCKVQLRSFKLIERKGASNWKMSIFNNVFSKYYK